MLIPGFSRPTTPYQNGAQMAVSPVEGLADATKAATMNLNSSPKVFDGIFLFYPVRDSQWLAQIWPTLECVRLDWKYAKG
jgi:hypothetical protein